MTGRLSDWPENDPDLVQIHANHSEVWPVMIKPYYIHSLV